MKHTIITALFAFVALTMAAQDRLIRVDSESTILRKTNSQGAMFESEKSRLLMPQGVAFGVECVPSFTPEWTLTYDSVAHVLVYKIAEKSVWHTTYRSMHKLKKVGKNHSKWVPRKHPKQIAKYVDYQRFGNFLFLFLSQFGHNSPKMKYFCM